MDEDINDLGDYHTAAERCGALWDDLLPNISPQQLYDALTKDLPEGTRLDVVKFATDIYIQLYQPAGYGQPDEDHSFVFTRHLSRNDDGQLYSYDGDIRLGSAQQGQGLGKVLQRNMIMALKDIGYSYLEDQCTHIGSYVWAKLGYEFNAKALDKDKRLKLIEIFKERLDAVAEHLPQDVYMLAKRHAVLTKPNYIQVLSDLSHSFNETVSKGQGCDQGSALSVAAYDYANRRLNRFQADDFDKLWSDYTQTGDQFTLGKYLLLSSGWPGRLDLEDDHKMQRVKNFLNIKTP